MKQFMHTIASAVAYVAVEMLLELRDIIIEVFKATLSALIAAIY